MMGFKKIFFGVFVFLFLLNISYAVNETGITNPEITVFAGRDCPHCKELIEYLNEIKDDFPNLTINTYEVTYNESNRIIFQEYAKKYNISIQGVPTYFISDSHFVGYHSSMNEEILSKINSLYETNTSNTNSTTIKDETINIPFFGEINLSELSLPILTVLLGFLDGFNPCAFFVLFFLLSMLVYAKSRKRMLIIGMVFVFFSGFIYFLFMIAWLTFFEVTSNATYVTLIAGAVALIIGIINVKDFFAFKKGVSLSISDKHRKTLISKMRDLLKESSLFIMILGTVVLAITANLYELLCTAGFPMVFTKILVLNNLPTSTYYYYLILYNIFYVLPLLAIVLTFSYTLGAKKLSQEQGEALKLVSGVMMLSLGSVLVFNPGLLNNVISTIFLMFGAIFITGLILFIRKRINESKNKTSSKNKRVLKKLK